MKSHAITSPSAKSPIRLTQYCDVFRESLDSLYKSTTGAIYFL